MDTDMRDAVEADFVEAYTDHQEALLEEYGRRVRWCAVHRVVGMGRSLLPRPNAGWN